MGAEWEAFKVVLRDTAINTTTGAHQQINTELKQVEDKLGTLENKAALDPTMEPELQEAHRPYAELLDQLHVIDHCSYAQSIRGSR